MTEEERQAGSFAFPTDTYPKSAGAMPIQAKPSVAERAAAAQFLRFRVEVRDGPLYTGSKIPKRKIELEQGDQQEGDGIKRYTDRYVKKSRAKKNMEDHPYLAEFFPTELYEAMGFEPAENGTLGDGSVKKKKFSAKKLDITKFTADLLKTSMDVDELDTANGGVADEESRARAIESIKKSQQDAAVTGKEEEKEESAESEAEDEMEDEFESDEDDDYNAERYFDDGEGDGDDDGGNDEAAY